MAYTMEQKERFLIAVEKIQEAFHEIMEIDGGHIINEVGLEAYPFDNSFDELQIGVIQWSEKIFEEMRPKARKGA